MSSQYIESDIKALTRDVHRALASLQEELEAIDYYQQRSDSATDPELKAILEHNREEEVEHAVLLFEWLRRHAPDFDEKMKTYVFQKGSLLDIEIASEHGGAIPDRTSDLGIGKLK